MPSIRQGIGSSPSHQHQQKLNTVVTALNWQEEMSMLVRRVCSERWRVSQVLPMEGQNHQHL
jgi:hypothetical protein